MLYSRTKFACSAKAILYSIQRLSRFASTITCNDAVIEVFPKLAISLQINEDGSLLSSFIGHEINAFHCTSLDCLSWR